MATGPIAPTTTIATCVINTVSGTFTVTDNGLGTITVTGPGSATFQYPRTASLPGWGSANDWQCQANMSAHKFCYSWSADKLSQTRNNELATHNASFDRYNESFDKHNDTQVALTNTHYDLRDDIRAVKHRAVNVDEGIYTQKACWETACIENKAQRLSSMMNAPGIDTPVPTHSMLDDYIRNKTELQGVLSNSHTSEISDDLPQVTPRTSGSLT